MASGGVEPTIEDCSAIYFGKVVHARLKPKRHKLTYSVFSFLIDLDDLEGLDRRLRWFSRNRFNLFSFYDRDFGVGASDDIAAYVRGVLSEHDVDGAGPIKLLAYPRMLGYAFNPIAVYYCHNSEGAPSAMLYEVRSTFGERHTYLIPIAARPETDGVLRQTAAKKLHVSPFMDMAMQYQFRVTPPGETLRIAIHEEDADGPILNAAFDGDRAPFTDAVLLRAFFRYPLMTLKVIAGIHWEAVKLLLKGLRLKSGPSAPSYPVTLVE
ncbi:MAG: DUF1365 domain-containing protein [Pseudomonadota bacterium]